MTAHAMAGDAEKYLQAGMDGYVSEPIQVNLLQAQIDRLTKKTEPGQENSARRADNDSLVSTFDHQELLARVENDCDLLNDLLKIFKEEFPRQLLSLHKAVKAADGTRVAAAAHTMRGMLSNLAATRAAATAARLEQLARQGETSAFEEAFAAFESDVRELLPQLDACVPEACK
jgi:two-component system sensor histidine kinase/response regulator